MGIYDEFKELAQPKSFDYYIYGDGESEISYEQDTYTIDPDGSGPGWKYGVLPDNFTLHILYSEASAAVVLYNDVSAHTIDIDRTRTIVHSDVLINASHFDRT